MLEQRVDRDLVAVHDVEDAVRDARFLQQLRRVHRRRRILLRRLQHERVPTRKRRRPHPHRHHRREIERRDPRHHTNRLPDRVHIDPGRGLLRELPLQQGGDPAGELDHLEAARHLAHRVRQHLAVLGHQELRDLLLARMHQLADVEHQLRAFRQRNRAPRREGSLRSLDGAIDLLHRGQIHRAALCPVAGLKTGLVRPDPPATEEPPIQ